MSTAPPSALAPFPTERLAARVEACRRRTAAWLETLAVAGEPAGVVRISAAHDPARWPGVLLPGTYNALMLRALIGELRQGAEARARLVAWLEGFRLPDGRFRITGMTDDTVYKKPDPAETWRYIDFHVTNYTLGAIAALDPARPPLLDFARPFLDPLQLGSWLSLRDLRDPWQEGNNIVNLASFLLLRARFGDAAERASVARALDQIFAWHERLQEPATGFWGVGQLADPERLLHAFAGSMHNFHLWYATDRPLPFQDKAVDYVLGRAPAVHSACIDVDAADLLVHAHRSIAHRRAAIEAWLLTLLDGLLDAQNPDGGFCDVRTGERRQDGWVGGYVEPQGLSNTFATYFRWIAIAMIADLLWPQRWPWRFRAMLGIGYRRAPGA